MLIRPSAIHFTHNVVVLVSFFNPHFELIKGALYPAHAWLLVIHTVQHAYRVHFLCFCYLSVFVLIFHKL